MSRTGAHYEFGDFALDVGEQCLLRRDTGQTIVLTTKVFETLLYFVEHAGETLDKDVLLRSIWPGVVVEENSLTQNVSTLRQALGEARGENRYIATVARRGYRFVAKVTRRDAAMEPSVAAPPAAARRPRLLLVAAAAVSIVVIAAIIFFASATRPRETAPLAARTLAILPFKPLLPAERNESLELGMAESLISHLSQPGRQAISPLSSVRRYGALDQDPIAAGRELGVDTVLDGSLQRSGNRLRVAARLLRVADGQQLWAQSFDQDFTTIFDVQDTIAARVAQAISVGQGVGSTRGTPYTQDSEAYALYASGQFAWARQTEPSLLQAIGFFEQAIARDPNYALAYASLADTYALLGVFGMRAPREVFPKARSAVEKALSIDPDLAAAHSALGHIKMMYEHDWDGAAREYARALQIDPSLAVAYHRRGLLYAIQGDIEHALQANARAQQLEPLWLAPKGAAGNFLYLAGRYDESIQLCEKILALDEGADNARSFLIRNLLVKGDYERALAEYDRRPLQMPGSNAHRAQALALSGQRAAALAELDRVLKFSKERYVPAYDIALIYAALADTENTFLWLDRAVEDRSTLMVFLARDPMFDAFHSDPRWNALVQRVGA
ncbi:MAG TPA: winged helix-turn-helix domain-containing protein [Steroidobacteraceae bacterium]|jgi:DNA-binding winged helix-turn-helix (wHTH) protein/TolB-like protein|nr:winged helix-turn-helix domain-containing protein [Steroidobacteraceae bacterium]